MVPLHFCGACKHRLWDCRKNQKVRTDTMGDSPSAHRCYERWVILPVFPNVGRHRIQTTKLLKNAVDGLRVHNPQANLLCTSTVFSQELQHEIPVALEEEKRKEADTYPKQMIFQTFSRNLFFAPGTTGVLRCPHIQRYRLQEHTGRGTNQKSKRGPLALARP